MSTVASGRRRLPLLGFLAVVVVWIAIIKVVGSAVHDRAGAHDGRLLTAHSVLWTFVVPVGAGVVFVYLVVAALGWWRPVLRDAEPTRRWVWWIAVVFAIGIAAGVNYGGLADRGIAFTLTLFAAAMLIGFGEEGLFRGIGVTALRDHGFSETRVALWSSVVFGLAHVANLIGGDARALAQAIIVSFAGYFFYLIRRVSRSNVLNSILHGLFDFVVITGVQIIPAGGKAYPGPAAAIAVYVVCGVICLVQRHRVEPGAVTSA